MGYTLAVHGQGSSAISTPCKGKPGYQWHGNAFFMTSSNDDPAVEAADGGDDMDYAEHTADDLGISEAEVIHYLLQNPQFLVDHIEILRKIAPREEWSGDSVIDLQSVIVDRSQEAMDDLRSATQSVIETSRSNMSIQTRTHEAVKAILEADDSFEDVVRIVTEDWPHILDVDVVSLGFEFTRAPFPAMANATIRKLPLGTIRHLLGPDLNVRLFAEMIDDGTLFGEGSGLAHSAALARIEAGFELPPGVLSLGARDETFGPGQGTELLAFLSDVVAATIRRCLTRRP